MSEVPPIEPMLDDGELPGWPPVVGITSICWGVLGLLCNGCGVASPLLIGMVPQNPQMGPMPDIMKPGIGQVSLAGIGLAMSVLLIIAGVATLQRQFAGRMLHLAWAGINLVLTVVGVAIAIKTINDQMAWKAANPDNLWAKQMNPFFSYIGIAIAVLLGGAWPVFCLVWFGLIKKTAESFTRNPLPAE